MLTVTASPRSTPRGESCASIILTAVTFQTNSLQWSVFFTDVEPECERKMNVYLQVVLALDNPHIHTC